MKKTLITSTVLVFLTMQHVRAQDRVLPELSLKNINYLHTYIQKYYKVDSDFEMRACLNCILFAKFKVTVDGKIDSLEISKNGPEEIKKALRTAITATDGLWKFTANEKRQVADKTFLLPLICYYQAGCAPGLVDTATIKKQALTQLLNTPRPDATLHSALDHMMEFEGATYQNLNCTLLSPVFAGLMQ